ncbi:hypothetical protein HDU96_004614 [Phlyctochytrium bullatum]|nr:hypothetical protein HDU96_004614 [Phlyctochytrium bullatum]
MSSAQLSELLSKLRAASDIPQLRLDHMNSLLRVIRASKDPLDLDPILECLRSCLCDSAKEIRANAFRILRHIVTDASVALAMISFQVDLFIVRALTRDQRNDLEREQALKLVRAFVEDGGGDGVVPHSVVRTLVAIAEQPDDKFRIVALETLCELAVTNIEAVALCGGLKSIFGALLDGPQEILEMLIITVTHILDQERTRAYVRPSVDLEVSEFRPGPDILPSDEIRRVGVESLYDIFRISSLGNLYEFMTSKGRQDVTQIVPPNPRKISLMAHIISVLLIVFVDCGLVETLIDIAQDSNRDLSLRAIVLIGELLQLTHRLLPSSYWAKVQPIASLFHNASNFQDEQKRHASTAALAAVDGILRWREKSFIKKYACVLKGHDVFPNLRFIILAAVYVRPQRAENDGKLERLRIPSSGTQKRLDYSDDNQFKGVLADIEKMLGSKDFLRWNWDTIQELIEGPLTNPRRMEEAIKNSKVVKRLVSFYKPLNHQFSDIKKGKIYSSSLEPIFSKSRIELTLTGEYFSILSCFTSNPEGIRLLEKFRIFNILYHLTELRSRDDLIKTMVRSLDFSKEGHERVIIVKLMTSSYKHIRLFTTQHLGGLMIGCNEEFALWAIPLLITQLYDPSPEVAEAAAYSLLKSFDDNEMNLEIMTENLRYVIRAELCLHQAAQLGKGSLPLIPRTPMESPQPPSVNSTSDSADEKGDLDTLIAFPRHLYGELTKTAAGCRHLEATGHVSVLSAGVKGAVTLVSRNEEEWTDDDLLRVKSALWAVGFIGSNSPGLDLICKEDLVDDIVMLALNSRTLSIRGTCYYALGLIGKCPRGAEILGFLGWEVVSIVEELAAATQTAQGKGAAGAKNLPTNGSVSSSGPGGTIPRGGGAPVSWSWTQPVMTAVAVPVEIHKFITIPKWEFKGSWPDAWREETEYLDEGPEVVGSVTQIGAASLRNGADRRDKRRPTFDATGEEILKLVGNMGNHILANAASKGLSRLRHEYPAHFASIHLYLEVSRMLSCLHYRMTARRFIQELFDRVPFDDASGATLAAVASSYRRY